MLTLRYSTSDTLRDAMELAIALDRSGFMERPSVDHGDLVLEFSPAYVGDITGIVCDTLDDDFTVSDGRYDWGQCDDSGDWYPEHDLMETPDNDGRIHCDLWYERYDSCEQCGHVDCRDNLLYQQSSEETVCEDCYRCDEIQEFDGISKEFGPANSFGSSRSFGVELETQSGYCSECYAFDGKDDGSISGTEYVSHKLRGDDGMSELREFMASGEGITVDRSCGVHVHVNCSDLDDQELYAVYAAYVVTQGYWESKVDSSRIDGGYCKRIATDSTFADILDALHRSHPLPFREFSPSDRYKWLNRSAYYKHGTLENRLLQGSWDYETVSSWIKLNLRFVRAARYLRIEPHDTVESYKAKADIALQWAASGSQCHPYTATARELAECA